MNKQFEKWVEESIRQHCNRPGMITGAQHPLGHYQAKRAAMLAWDHQQEKIDGLVEALEYAAGRLHALDDPTDFRIVDEAITKARGDDDD